MSRKSKYSIEQRVQACEDYHNGTRSLEEICIANKVLRRTQKRDILINKRHLHLVTVLFSYTSIILCKIIIHFFCHIKNITK